MLRIDCWDGMVRLVAKLFHEETRGEFRRAFEREVLDWPEVSSRKMFGCPAYRAGGTLFAFVIDDGIVLTKLGEADRQELAERFGAGPFEPGRGTIQRWAVVPVSDELALSPVLDYVRKSYGVAMGDQAPSLDES